MACVVTSEAELFGRLAGEIPSGRLACAVLPGHRAPQKLTGALFPGKNLFYHFRIRTLKLWQRQAKLLSWSYPLLFPFLQKPISQIRNIALVPPTFPLRSLSQRENTVDEKVWQALAAY